MTNEPEYDAGRIADILRGYTQRTIRLPDEAGGTYARQPSMRWIEKQTGIPHQRISEFLRNPDSATAFALERIASVVESPELEQLWSGERVTYFDAPAMTSERLANLRIPPNARGYRFVTPTDEERYKGYRSSEWLADFNRLDELADAVPGGREAITRIVFDTGE